MSTGKPKRSVRSQIESIELCVAYEASIEHVAKDSSLRGKQRMISDELGVESETNELTWYR